MNKKLETLHKQLVTNQKKVNNSSNEWSSDIDYYHQFLTIENIFKDTLS